MSVLLYFLYPEPQQTHISFADLEGIGAFLLVKFQFLYILKAVNMLLVAGYFDYPKI
jgi:hypothetical protein